MENHPIPQDVTGFQFKLIGEMTIKQFAYVACGVILSWISFYLPLSFLARLPLIFLFGGTGASLAFLPLEGRPLDVMISHFIKALFSPNQYMYEKMGGNLLLAMRSPAPSQKAATTTTQDRLHTYLTHLPQQTPHSKLDEKEKLFLQSVSNLSPSTPSHITFIAQPKPIQSQPTPPPVSPTPIQTASPIQNPQPSLVQQEKTLQKQEDEIKEKLEHTQTATLEQQLQQILSQKEELEKEIAQLYKSIRQQNPPAPPTPTIRQVPAGMGAQIGIPITPEDANLLVGIVKDARGNVIPNILVEVKDSSNNPVRAFKTNRLGQFASATPLISGTYRVDFEDPEKNHKFAAIDLHVTGEIIPPMEVISIDAREELRKDLFGG